MTYEKFEQKVLGMLLEGDDPRLERLIAQTWDAEVLSRDETEMGFTVKFLAPSPLAINESDGRIFGVEVKLSEHVIINLELVINNGLIDRLKGTSTTEISYAALIQRYNDLTFSYKNEKSSELNFHSDNHDKDEVTFVKNIATISKEIDASISKGLEAEKDGSKSMIEPELIEEPFTLILDPKEIEKEIDSENELNSGEQEVLTSALIEEPFTLIPNEKEIDKAIKIQVEDQEKRGNSDQNLVEKRFTLVSDDESPKSTEALIVEASKIDNVLLPPSFSIPRVPEEIRKRWSGEAPRLGEDPKKEALESIPKNEKIEKKTVPRIVIPKVSEMEPKFEDILGGKAPQGPITFSELLPVKEEQEENVTDESLASVEKEVVNEKKEEKAIEVKKTPGNSLPKTEVVTIEEDEPNLLSTIDLEEVNRSIALMEQKNKIFRMKKSVWITIVLLLLVVSWTSYQARNIALNNVQHINELRNNFIYGSFDQDESNFINSINDGYLSRAVLFPSFRSIDQRRTVDLFGFIFITLISLIGWHKKPCSESFLNLQIKNSVIFILRRYYRILLFIIIYTLIIVINDYSTIRIFMKYSSPSITTVMYNLTFNLDFIYYYSLLGTIVFLLVYFYGSYGLLILDSLKMKIILISINLLGLIAFRLLSTQISLVDYRNWINFVFIIGTILNIYRLEKILSEKYKINENKT